MARNRLRANRLRKIRRCREVAEKDRTAEER